MISECNVGQKLCVVCTAGAFVPLFKATGRSRVPVGMHMACTWVRLSILLHVQLR
jgi:hypothetical protein